MDESLLLLLHFPSTFCSAVSLTAWLCVVLSVKATGHAVCVLVSIVSIACLCLSVVLAHLDA